MLNFSWFERMDPATRAACGVAAAAVVLAALGGALLAYGGPLVGAAVVVGLLGAAWVMRSVRTAFIGLIAVVLVIPFATLPIKIVLTLTFLDLALGAALVLWALDAYRRNLAGVSSTPALPAQEAVAAFLLLCVFSFVAGLGHASLTPMILRHFAELLLSVAFFLAVGWTASERGALRLLVQAVILCGALAALIGIVLWLLPDVLANRVLNVLVVFGYPGGDVLRYIEDNPDLPERAIGLAVDPNVFGGMLSLTTALALPHVFAPRPVLPRWLAWLVTGIGGVGLLLTFSRAAMAGFACAGLFLALVRYRRLLGLLVVAGALVLVLPQTQYYVERFTQGLQNEDLATQMRYGEYKDAFILIQRYPLFGVGFAGVPDRDLYLGVSSMYLLLAEQMGLVGLAGFALIVGTLYVQAWRTRRALAPDDPVDAIWLGLMAALIAALVDGVLDHYFFNLEFHHAVTLFWLTAGLLAGATGIRAHVADAPGPRDSA